MSWTDERVEQLRKLWTDGLSASQIASALGNGITRNAVIGKVHRLGLSGRVKAPSSSASRSRVAQPRTPRSSSPRRPSGGGGGGGSIGNTALAYAPRTYSPPAPKRAEDVVIPMSERVTIMELKENMCRWPLGDPQSPDFRYCGLGSDGAGAYCCYHSTIAYQPVQERRRERDRERRAQARAG